MPQQSRGQGTKKTKQEKKGTQIAVRWKWKLWLLDESQYLEAAWMLRMSRSGKIGRYFLSHSEQCQAFGRWKRVLVVPLLRQILRQICSVDISLVIVIKDRNAMPYGRPECKGLPYWFAQNLSKPQVKVYCTIRYGKLGNSAPWYQPSFNTLFRYESFAFQRRRVHKGSDTFFFGYSWKVRAQRTSN